MKLAGLGRKQRVFLGGGVVPAEEIPVMPTTTDRRTAPPDGWPETPQTIRSIIGGSLAWALLIVLGLVAFATAWAACEVHQLRADIQRERGADMMGGKK